jgi:hypothetical protein
VLCPKIICRPSFIEYLDKYANFNREVTEYAFGNPHRLSVPELHTAEQPKIQVVRQRFNPRMVKIAQRESLMWGSTQQKAIEFGNVTHEVLSVKTRHDIDTALTKAIENGLITTASARIWKKSYR